MKLFLRYQPQRNHQLEGKDPEDLLFCYQHRVGQKLTDTNPGLEGEQGLNFSCIKVLFIANDLGSLRLINFKTGGQKIMWLNVI